MRYYWCFITHRACTPFFDNIDNIVIIIIVYNLTNTTRRECERVGANRWPKNEFVLYMYTHSWSPNIYTCDVRLAGVVYISRKYLNAKLRTGCVWNSVGRIMGLKLKSQTPSVFMYHFKSRSRWTGGWIYRIFTSVRGICVDHCCVENAYTQRTHISRTPKHTHTYCNTACSINVWHLLNITMIAKGTFLSRNYKRTTDAPLARARQQNCGASHSLTTRDVSGFLRDFYWLWLRAVGAYAMHAYRRGFNGGTSSQHTHI